MASVAELEAELAEIEKAIRKIYGGASYSIGGKSLTRANLEELTNRRTEIIRAIKYYGGSDEFRTATWN